MNNIVATDDKLVRLHVLECRCKICGRFYWVEETDEHWCPYGCLDKPAAPAEESPSEVHLPLDAAALMIETVDLIGEVKAASEDAGPHGDFEATDWLKRAIDLAERIRKALA